MTTTTVTIDIGRLLESRQDVQGGSVVLRDTRTTVESIAAAHLVHRMSLPDILADNPQLSMAGLHAALAYYYQHRNEFELREKADAAWGAEQIAQQEREWGTRPSQPDSGQTVS